MSVANRNEGTITICAKLFSYSLSRYASEAIIAEADEKIRNFKQSSSTPTDFPQELWEVALRCGRVYNEQTLRAFSVEGIERIIRNTVLHWLADNEEATLKDLSHETEALLDLNGGHRKSTEKEGQWTKPPWRSIESFERREKPCRVIAVQENGTPFSSDKSAYSPSISWAQVVSQIVLAPTSKWNKSNSYMDSSTYCRVCYSRNHGT